jgi:hypothetical protein
VLLFARGRRFLPVGDREYFQTAGQRNGRMSNVFHKALDYIRFKTKETGNVQLATKEFVPDIITGVIEHPFDCGVKRFRSLSLSRQARKSSDGSAMPVGYLLVVRATTEAGEDVVAFFDCQDWQSCFLEFAYDVECGGIAWKDDKPRDQRFKSKSFLDTLADAIRADSNGDVRGNTKTQPGG